MGRTQATRGARAPDRWTRGKANSPAPAGPQRVISAEAIVVGAGTAGLAAAAALRQIHVETIVLEQTPQVAASWRSRYDGLRLNTPGWMSAQPGLRASRRRYGEYPTRDAWIEYLENYAEHHRIDVRFGTEVQHVMPVDGGWRVGTNQGELQARFVVIATGYDHDPALPDWPGREGFTGELIHSSAYRNPEPYRDRDVLVIGPGTTGSEVAFLVSEGGAGRVRVACRTVPNLIRRKVWGVPVNLPGLGLNRLPLRVGDQVGWLMQRALFGNLERYGLSRSPEGLATVMRLRRRGPAYDDGFVRALKAGELEIVPAVVGFEGPEVLLADGARIQPDAVIAATGYRRGLERMVGHLNILDEDGVPLPNGAAGASSAAGLFFIGYRADLSGQLRLMRGDAREIARAVRGRRARAPRGSGFAHA